MKAPDPVAFLLDKSAVHRYHHVANGIDKPPIRLALSGAHLDSRCDDDIDFTTLGQVDLAGKLNVAVVQPAGIGQCHHEYFPN